jgi:hypothetical protein
MNVLLNGCAQPLGHIESRKCFDIFDRLFGHFTFELGRPLFVGAHVSYAVTPGQLKALREYL